MAASRPDGSAAGLWAGGLLGFALGGFFDGILLHQVLQWHHLLSGLEGEPWRDLRVQVLADGLFHAAMYGIAVAGLAQLWRLRGRLAWPGMGRILAAGVLIGFGLWHLADAVVSHWLLGLHHIRMDSGNRLLWDLLFFALGLVLTAAGVRLLRTRHGGKTGGGGRVALLLALLVPAAGVSARPGGNGTSLLLTPRDLPATAVLQRVAALDGRLVDGDAASGVWIVRWPDGTGLARRLGLGAVPLAGPVLGVGCFQGR